jgi:hypothetical protein
MVGSREFYLAEFHWEFKPGTLIAGEMVVSRLEGELECTARNGHLTGYQYQRTVAINEDGKIIDYHGTAPLLTPCIGDR